MKGYLVMWMLPLCLLLSSCGAGAGLPYAREMEDMALLRTMGVDAVENGGGLTVTVSTGERARGLQGEKQAPLILSAQRGTLSGACLALQGLSDSYVFYGYVDQLLLGEEMAKAGIQPVLDYFAKDVELGLGAQLWLVKGASAAQAIEAGHETGVDSRLATLQNDGEMGAGSVTCTAGEVFSALLEDGAGYVPALIPAQGESSTLLEEGYGVLKDGVLTGWLEGEQARGLELLAGHPPVELWEWDLPCGRVSARWKSTMTRCTPVFQGEKLVRVELSCQISAAVEESPGPLSRQEREQLRQSMEEAACRRAEDTLAQLQSWGADCLGLGRQLGLAQPARWAALEPVWREEFPEIALAVSARVELAGQE